MNTDLLRTFIEVAKTRHFGDAAENLYLTQSAVSARVKQLEATLGVALFDRQRNNILLTSAGERLLPHAENILAAWQMALQEVGVMPDQSIPLTLGGTSNLWDTCVQALLPQLALRFPNLHIRTEVNTSHELIRSLLGGRSDIVVVLDAPVNGDLVSTLLGHLSLVMVSHQPHVRMADVPANGYVYVDWGTAFNLKQAKLFDHPVAPRLHTGQAHIALDFLLNHGGCVFLPQNIVAPYLKEKRLYLVDDVETTSQAIYLVFSKQSDKAEHLQPIIEVMTSFAV